MVSRAGGDCRWTVTSYRQLPITGFAHKTRVISDPAVAAFLAPFDMAAENSRAAVLDGRHHLELTEAHMPGVGFAPSGTMAMEDVCDLQFLAAHGGRLYPRWRPPFGRRREPVEWAGHGADGGVGDAGVQRGGVELGVTDRFSKRGVEVSRHTCISSNLT